MIYTVSAPATTSKEHAEIVAIFKAKPLAKLPYGEVEEIDLEQITDRYHLLSEEQREWMVKKDVYLLVVSVEVKATGDGWNEEYEPAHRQQVAAIMVIEGTKYEVSDDFSDLLEH